MDGKKTKKITRGYIDVDGVLTDGHLTIDDKGTKLFKRFHTRDVRAIRTLIKAGIQIFLVTADEDWQGIKVFAEKVGASVLFAENKSYIPKFEPFFAITDDPIDMPMLEGAALRYTPSDGSVNMPAYVMSTVTAGGCGVIEEILPEILAYNADIDD